MVGVSITREVIPLDRRRAERLASWGLVSPARLRTRRETFTRRYYRGRPRFHARRSRYRSPGRVGETGLEVILWASSSLFASVVTASHKPVLPQ